MRRETVHDDNVSAFERRSQTAFDVRQERLSAHCAVNRERRRHSIAAQSGHERDRLPVSMRHTADQAFAARASATQPHHFGIGGGLVDEHQPGRIKHGLLSFPAPARPGDVLAFLLRRAQAFF